ncbi:hypothetical protein Tco_0735212 [Tanacetum coccineum]
MVVQNQSQMGEDLAIPSDPHHTLTIIQPLTQPQKTQNPRKPKIKDTQVPQSSDPSENVTDEAIHKELGDSLVRAATTTSCLEAEQNSGNINKTQSKATPNESSSQGTTSGGGPRGNTLRSDEDILKLYELMALCTTLQTRVLDLEKTNTSQHNEIASLKRRVKKLKKKNRSRTHKLKRLYKVGLTTRVESSGDEESLGEDASKQERINAIDTDEEITVNKKFIAGVATTISAATTTTDDDGGVTLAQALIAMKSIKPKVKGIVIQELGESTTIIASQPSSQQSHDKGKGIMIEPKKDLQKRKLKMEKEANITLIETWDDIQANIDVDHQLAERLQAQEQEELFIEEKATLFQQLLEKRRKHFAAKIAEEKRNKPPTKAQQGKIMCTYLKNMEGYKLNDLKLKDFDYIQEMFDKAFKRQKVEDDKETAELKHCLEIILDEEEVIIDGIPLAVKSPSIVGWKIHKEGRKSYYQIIRADGKSQIERLGFVVMGDLKTMFEPHVEDKVWRNQQDYKVLDWKLYDSCGVQSLRMQHMQIYMLVKKKYPLAPLTLSMMLEKKLIIDYESEMAYQLLKFIMKQLKKK